ncbi:coaE operon protein [Halobacteriales archaeon SW_7_68_16]|nr:MAG: coaE operon protein [Halobacteriales archaeon SW_7_68_16]
MTAYRVTVSIEAPVHGTEIGERVADAVRELFPEADVEGHSDRVTGTAHTLDTFSERLHEQAILDTARSVFFDGRHEDGFRFAVKKAAAFRGLVNFAVGTPDELGEIEVAVTVDAPGVEAYIDHVAPPTEDGVPVTEHDDG